jgi:putative lipoic acid-binding regulatory protein
MAPKKMAPLELLESAHTFPGPYTFKVIGLADRGFLARTVAAVREELAHAADPPYRVRESAGGRHIAITIEPQVQTAQQVLDVYRRLSATAGLVMLW